MSNIKARPGGRQQILKLGIRPFIENGAWDGLATVRSNGDRSTVLEVSRCRCAA